MDFSNPVDNETLLALLERHNAFVNLLMEEIRSGGHGFDHKGAREHLELIAARLNELTNNLISK